MPQIPMAMLNINEIKTCLMGKLCSSDKVIDEGGKFIIRKYLMIAFDGVAFFNDGVPVKDAGLDFLFIVGAGKSS